MTAGWLPVLAAAAVYFPIVADYFKYDDFLHLYQIVNHGPLEFLLTPHGGHLLVSSNLVFYLCYRLFGLSAAGYQAVALLTHLLTIVLLQLALRQLTGRPRLAAGAAALWGMSPMAYGSISWFSVYGHALCGAAVAGLLYDATRPANARAAAPPGALLRWLALLLVAATSFGVGIGVAAASGPILYLLRPAAPDRRRVALLFGGLVPLLPALYLAQHQLFAWLSGVEPRQLSILRSLGRLGPNLSMVADLMAAGAGSLLLGPLAAVHGPEVSFGPLAGLGQAGLLALCRGLAAAAVLGLLFAWARAPGEARTQLLALLLVATSAYGIVALGRVGVMQQLDLPLSWLAMAPRYHYLGPMAFAALGCVALAAALPAPDPAGATATTGRGGRSRALALLALLALATPAYAGAVRSFEPSGEPFREQHRSVLAWIEESARREPQGGAVYLPNRKIRSLGRVSAEEFPRAAALFVLSRPSLEVDGRRVYFVEKSWSVRAAAAARKGSPITQVMVGPGDVPRSDGG